MKNIIANSKKRVSDLYLVFNGGECLENIREFFLSYKTPSWIKKVQDYLGIYLVWDRD